MMNETYITNKQKLIAVLYLESIYDKKGKLQLIPRNYFHNTKIITSPREVVEQENCYNTKTMVVPCRSPSIRRPLRLVWAGHSQQRSSMRLERC